MFKPLLAAFFMAIAEVSIFVAKEDEMAKGYLTAEQLINESLAEIRDFDRKYFQEAAMYFMRGYREFMLFEAVGQVAEKWCAITSVNTVNYPEDAMRIIDLSVLVNGEYFPFTRADNIADVSDPLDKARNTSRGEDVTLEREPSYGYGMKGVNLEYYYKDDKDKRRLVLSRVSLDKLMFADRAEVLVRYVSEGITDLNTANIAKDAANLLMAYVVYKLVASRPDKYNNPYIAFKKEEYVEQLKMYRALNMPSLQELSDMIYETSGQNARK